MANKKIGFYSDSAGTVPINVTSNTPVGVKTLYTDNLTNTSTQYVENYVAQGTNILVYNEMITNYQSVEAHQDMKNVLHHLEIINIIIL